MRFTIKLLVLVMVAVLAGCASGPKVAGEEQVGVGQVAEEQAAEESVGVSDESTVEKSGVEGGLDARLEGFKYPYPVEFFGFESQRQVLEMAYMDVMPEVASGEVVVLLHGKNFSGAYWERTIASLVKDGYRVVVPDQIGFGKSSKPEAFQFSFQELAVQTRALLDELGVKKAYVVGHSMGGMLGARFALMYPERVESLALVNPIGLEDWKLVVSYQSVDVWYEAELKGDPETVREYMRFAYFDGKWDPAYDELIEIQGGWKIGPDAERMAWMGALTFDMIFTQPVLYEFDKIDVPTLLIIGVRDRTALGRNLVSKKVAAGLGNYEELGRKAAEAIPNSTLVELDNVGHVPQFEDFERYNKALRGFLAGE